MTVGNIYILMHEVGYVLDVLRCSMAETAKGMGPLLASLTTVVLDPLNCNWIDSLFISTTEIEASSSMIKVNRPNEQYTVRHPASASANFRFSPSAPPEEVALPSERTHWQVYWSFCSSTYVPWNDKIAALFFATQNLNNLMFSHCSHCFCCCLFWWHASIWF